MKLPHLYLLFLALAATPLSAETIKIGAVYPLTGPASVIGEGNRLGAEIAAELINESGGINGAKIQLIVEDSQTEPRVGVTAFRKLIDVDKVQVALSSLTSVGMAIKPIADQSKVLLLAESTHPDLVRGQKFVIRNFYTVDVANQQIVKLIKKLGVKKVGILHAEEEWGEAALKQLQKSQSQGFELIAHESFSKGAADLKPQLLRLKEKGPELIYIIGIGPAVPTAYNQARELKLSQKLAGFVVCGQSNVLEPAKLALEGVYTVEPDLDVNSDSYKNLLNALLKKKPGHRMDQQIAIGFDAVNMIADAFSHGSRSGEQVRDYILKRQVFHGATGHIEFSADGDSKRPMYTAIVKNGECQRVDDTR